MKTWSQGNCGPEGITIGIDVAAEGADETVYTF